MIYGESDNSGLSITEQALLQLRESEDFTFYLTGSRFFETDRADSDYDFFVEAESVLENLSKLIDNSKTVDSDRCSLESNTLKLIKQLVTGIEAWAAEEDGVPNHVWNAYCQARLVIGKPLEIDPGVLQATNAILQATKTVNSAKVESAESNCASGKHYFQPMPSNMNIFGYLYCVHCGLRTFGRVE